MKLRLLLSAFFCMFLLAAQSQTVGIIGTATPGGWDVDTNMVQDVDSLHLYTLSIALTDGVVKFRQDDDWAVNWGPALDSMSYPSGIGVQDGEDIPIYAGDYDISFNSMTGAYYFNHISDIGIIGDATPGGWDGDLDMFRDQTDSNKFFIVLDLVPGAAKFRKDNDWAENWGPALDSMAFPSGIGIQDGENIPVDVAGNFLITLDTSTGAYMFEENVSYSSIGLIGDATPGGWDTDTELTRSASDPNEWTGNVALVGGEIKFRANGEWAVSWGGPAEFPADTAILGSNDNIAVDSTLAGDYLVNFNTETGIFSFLEVVNYASIGIIGDAVDGWEVDRDMVRSETDSAAWSLRTILKDGELKFRADDDWVDSWGGADFPSGIAGNPGVNTPITAGEYVITFNTITGAYNFEELVVFSTVGIIGTGTTIGDWDTDVDMEKDAVDEQLWTLDTDLVDGEIKFRAEDDWAVNWGPADQEGAFPSGTGVQDGANILSVAGTYRITLRSDDGSYSIDEPSSTKEPILKEVRIYPNPAQDFVNIELSTERIKGQVNIDIIDISGKKLISTRQLASGNMKINVSGLQAGNYFVSMYNKDFVLAKPITIVK